MFLRKKTNRMISSEPLSPLVQDTLSESALLPLKLLAQTHETDANYSWRDPLLRKYLAPLIVRGSKKINIGAPGSSLDGSEVHREDKNDYILPINMEAVLKESLYSDTVYAAECITSEPSQQPDIALM